MRYRCIVVLWISVVVFAWSAAAHADSTLRVGNQVLTAGDSAVRVTELLGRPSYKSHARRSSSGYSRGTRRSHGRRIISDGRDNVVAGEKWQYRRGDHVTTVTIVDGKVADIDDRRL